MTVQVGQASEVRIEQRPGSGGGRRILWILIPALVILYFARGVIAPFVVAAAIAYAFTPLVDSVCERSGARRGIVVLVGFLGAVLLLVLLGALLWGPLVAELQLLANQGPDAAAFALHQLLGRDSIAFGNTQIAVRDIAAGLQGAINGYFEKPGEALHLAATVGELGLQVILTLIITFYMLLDGYRFRDSLIRLLPPERRTRAYAVGARIHRVLGQWLRGQLLLIGLVATVTYVILGPILHVPYALALAILTGVLEVIPLIGPLIATVFAGLVAFSSGGTGLALTVVAIYFVIRQVEDQVVMPVVIGRAVHLHPVTTIFAVLVGLSTYGILGGLLAVPVAAALNVAFHEFELYDEEQTRGTIVTADPKADAPKGSPATPPIAAEHEVFPAPTDAA